MSREQWGHGYHRGIADAKKTECGYLGLFFHTLDECGVICCQGVIDKDLGGGRYLAKLFSWVDGEANGSWVISDIGSIQHLYRDHKAFLIAGALLMAEAAEKRGESRDIIRNHWVYYEMCKRGVH